ncbi:AcrR family transcriptional regulator [Paenibacillus sp. DS2015]
MLNIASNNDRRIRKSKTALKESLLSLIHEKDFIDISITDIVTRADLNRGTFYKHYQYKEDLLDEMINDVMAELIASYRDPYRDIEVFEIKYLTSSAIKIFEHVNENSDFYALILRANKLHSLQNRICTELKKLFLHDFSNSQPNSKINREFLASFKPMRS